MSSKPNKLTIQEGKKDYNEKWAENTKETLQENDKFDRGDKQFEAARAEEIAFDVARAEESAATARSHKESIMAGYKTGTKNTPEEEEEE